MVYYGKLSKISSLPYNFFVLFTDFSEDGNLRVKYPNTEISELPVLSSPIAHNRVEAAGEVAVLASSAWNAEEEKV